MSNSLCKIYYVRYSVSGVLHARVYYKRYKHNNVTKLK